MIHKYIEEGAQCFTIILFLHPTVTGCQVLRGCYSCLIYWSKELTFANTFIMYNGVCGV